MVNRTLRKELLTTLGVTPQALSQRAKRLKETYGPMSTDEAVYVIAHLAGIDVSKYLPLAMVDRVRALVPRMSPTTAGPPKTAVRKAKASSTPRYPLVNSSTARHGESLGQQVYPVLFQLENSIRAFIHRTIEPSGSDWWAKRVPPDVQRNVQRTMDREKRYPYRESRGSHPLSYANLDDLQKIIIDPKNWPDFQDVIIDREWFMVKMKEIYMARNNLAHCVPLSNDDISRILLLHRDWARLLQAASIM